MISHSCEQCGAIRVAKLSHGLGKICRNCYAPDPEASKATRETKHILAKLRRDFKLRRDIYVIN